MAYPQPDSNLPVTKKLPIFRIQTPLISAGDVYESEQGCSAVVVGPQSDISRVRLSYYDDNAQAQGFMQQAFVTPDRGFIGPISARNEATYQPSNVKGRILINSDDVFQPAYNPGSFASDERIQISPILDVIQYFGSPPNVLPQRADKLYRWDSPILINPNNKACAIIIPYYGRKFAKYTFDNQSAEVITFGVFGLDFIESTSSVTGTEHQILASAAVAAGNKVKGVVRASVDGMFDALILNVTRTNNGTNLAEIIRVLVSDAPE